MTRSPVPPRQRFRPGIDEIPDDVLEQIAHAGDCACAALWLDFPSDARLMAIEAISVKRNPWHRIYADWFTTARWAARKLGVEVK